MRYAIRSMPGKEPVHGHDSWAERAIGQDLIWLWFPWFVSLGTGKLRGVCQGMGGGKHAGFPGVLMMEGFVWREKGLEKANMCMGKKLGEL